MRPRTTYFYGTLLGQAAGHNHHIVIHFLNPDNNVLTTLPGSCWDRNMAAEKALENILGFTAANDISARDWQIQRGGSQWCHGKSFNTFYPLGPVIVTPDEIGDPNNLIRKP
ncbi:MAG: fumarylacetoacetate hydrolase family protein [Phycisphaerae bacterium]